MGTVYIFSTHNEALALAHTSLQVRIISLMIIISLYLLEEKLDCLVETFPLRL